MKLFFVPIIMTVALCWAAPLTQAQSSETQATGFVYHDQNQNGERDADEPGIGGVGVSNGTQIATTDARGHYQLPVSGDVTLFVIKPRGWAVPTDDHNLPQFYYTHKPEGSPEGLEYPGIEPTGPLPAEVNFPLRPRPEPSRFRVLLFGDPQPDSTDAVDYFAQDIVDELVGVEDFAFGVTMGDIVGNDLDLFDLVNEATSYVGVAPWHYVYGNHDMNFDAERDALADETFERVYGPTTYAFVHGGVHFLILDDVIYPTESGGYTGGLREGQMAFVENYLERTPEDALVVLGMHIPLNRVRESDRERLLSLMAERAHTLSLSAHAHQQGHFFMRPGSAERKRSTGRDSTSIVQARVEDERAHHHYVIGTTSGSWWSGIKGETGVPHAMMQDGTPNGYAIATFDVNQYVIDYKVAGRPADYRMNIWTPSPLVQDTTSDARSLLVNVFSGSEKTRVRYRLGRAGEWQTLQKVEQSDPYLEQLAERWEEYPELEDVPQLGGPVPGPSKSTHLWHATLPADLRAGRHLVKGRVTDMFGRVFEDAHTFRVVE